MIENIFSLQIFRKQICDPVLSNIQDEIKNLDDNNQLEKFMLSIRPHNFKTETDHPYMSDLDASSNFIKDYELFFLENEIILNANTYLHYITKPSNYNFTNFRITASNILYFPPGYSGLPHAHMPGKLSGVYYFKTKNTCGNFKMISPVPYPYPYFQDDLFHNLCHEYSADEGSMIIWPSWLLHEISENTSEEMRISISFQINYDVAEISR